VLESVVVRCSFGLAGATGELQNFQSYGSKNESKLLLVLTVITFLVNFFNVLFNGLCLGIPGWREIRRSYSVSTAANFPCKVG
jgi:hypothetical protein